MPLAGHGLRPPALRRRASRPQLKRDPLGSATAMNLIRPILPLLVASVVACHTQALSANENDVLIAALGELQGDSINLYDRLQSEEVANSDSISWLRNASWSRGSPSLLALASAFWSINRIPQSLSQPLDVPSLHVTLTHRPSSPRPHSDRWVAYLSRPAFSVSRDTALVAVSQMCGGRCGRTIFLLVVRSAGGWHREAVGGVLY